VEKRPKTWSCSNCAARRKSKQGTKSSDVSLKKGRKRVDSSSSEEGTVHKLFISISAFVYFLLALNTCTVLVDAGGEETEEVEKIAPPPGVTVRDVELFKKVQQTTSEVKQILH
jgi:hypothetical protein